MLLVINFFLTLCSSIRIIVDKTNFQSLIDISFKLPVFIVFYSPYCPHCTRMHPDWLKFMEQYKDDPYIVAAEINCLDFRKEANQIMSITGYPTYAVVIDGRGTSVSVTRTTKDFCAKAEEIKNKYPPRLQTIKCHYYSSNSQRQYPFMTLLASYSSSKTKDNNNVLKSPEDTCDILEKLSTETKLDINNFLVNQTNNIFNSSEYIAKSNSIVIATAFLSPAKTVEYKLNFNLGNINRNLLIDQVDFSHTNNSNFVTDDLIYDLDSLYLFANEYLVYKQFGDWDIINDENAKKFAFIESTRRLLLFVYDSGDNNADQSSANDESISNQIILKYKTTVTNNAEHFLASKISSTQLQKWNIKIQPESSSLNYININLIVSDLKKSKFALIKNIQSKNFNEIISNINSGFYDEIDDKELEPIKDIINQIPNANKRRSLLNQKKKRKSPLAFFAIGYLVCAIIITIVTLVVLFSRPDNSSNDSKNLIENKEIESDNGNTNDITSVLNIEADDDEDVKQNV